MAKNEIGSVVSVSVRGTNQHAPKSRCTHPFIATADAKYPCSRDVDARIRLWQPLTQSIRVTCCAGSRQVGVVKWVKESYGFIQSAMHSGNVLRRSMRPKIDAYTALSSLHSVGDALGLRADPASQIADSSKLPSRGEDFPSFPVGERMPSASLCLEDDLISFESCRCRRGSLLPQLRSSGQPPHRGKGRSRVFRRQKSSTYSCSPPPRLPCVHPPI